MIDAIKFLFSSHSSVSEYIIEFRRLIKMAPEEGKEWKEFPRFKDYYTEHLRPHFEFEENIMSRIDKLNPEEKEVELFNFIRAEHKKMNEMFAELIRLVIDNKGYNSKEISEMGLKIMDMVLYHADYEDQNLIPVFEKYLSDKNMKDLAG